MLVTRTSKWSGVTRSMELDVTEQEFINWRNGELVQNAFPNLTASEREFLISGMTDEEWDEAFGSDDYEDEF